MGRWKPWPQFRDSFAGIPFDNTQIEISLGHQEFHAPAFSCADFIDGWQQPRGRGAR